jgi:hypothetical protein
MNRTYLRLLPGHRLLVLAGLCIAAVMPMNSYAQNVVLRTGFPESAGVQMKTHNFTVENLRKAREMGFTVVRRAFHWNGIEKQKGVYDFTNWDAPMAEAERLGITIIGCWFGNNTLHEDDGRGGIQTDEGRKAFAAFAAACAERYKNQAVLWEVWNEPNVRTFWRKDGMHNSEEFATEYTDLVKAIMPAVLAVDPDAFVMVGSVSNYWTPSYEWTESCFKQGILDTGVKAWSVHPYGVKTPEEFAVGHRVTRDLLRKYGHPDMPMLNTERGFAIQELKNNEGWSGGSLDHVMKYQAWHFVRQYMADQMSHVPITVWYEWDGGDPWTGSAFALFNADGERPILTAAKVLFEQLNGYEYVGRIDTGYALDYVVIYQNGAGERKLVAWTAPPAGEAPEAAFPHQVQLRLASGSGVTATGVMGEAAAVTQAEQGVYLLNVSGAPQYVTIPSQVEVTAKSVEPYRAPAPAAAPIEGATDLKLFEAGAAWRFVPNTGTGSFELAQDNGKPIGVLQYDFTRSTSRTTPYVIAQAAVNIEQQGEAMVIHARSAIAQQLTFRLVDTTGQTHQFKGRVRGGGEWEAIRIPLNRRLEHWGGAADGKIHFPIKEVVLSVPMPDEEHKVGKVEYADALLVVE